MNGYLGEMYVKIEETPFAKYVYSDWVMYFIERYGLIDGEHHKLWVLDQVVRILKCSPIIVKLAQWDDGTTEYRVQVGKPSQLYVDWAQNMEYGGGYDPGIAP